MKTVRKIAGLIVGAALSIGGCSMNSSYLRSSNKGYQYSLENILPEKYKAMDLEHLGTVERSGAGDSYRTNHHEFVVTSFYQNKDRKLNLEDNLIMKFQKEDYDLMVVYQVCDGNIDNKKPIMIYAPHDGEGLNWWFQQKLGAQGKFYSINDLNDKFDKMVLADKDRFNSMSQEEFDRERVKVTKSTFANCGRKIQEHNHEGHHKGRNRHGPKKSMT